jgi:hypothetical protein
VRPRGGVPQMRYDMTIIVHTAGAMSDILRRGLAPITDNERALVDLGFERAYPQVRRGYDATIWERSIEYGTRPNGQRVMARQRAFLAAAS